MTVLRARADLNGKQVFYCTNTPNRVSIVQIRQTGFLLYNIAVYLYCYLDSTRCSWIIKPNNYDGRTTDQ